MSTVITEPTLGGGRTVEVMVALVKRSLVRVRRMPSTFIPSLVMPVFQVIAFGGTFAAAVKFAGIDNALDWYVPMAAIQGAAFGALGVAFGLIGDLQNGFFERLLMAPSRRGTLVFGPIAAAVIRAILPVALVVTVGFAGGMNLPGGVVGLLTLLLAAVGVAAIAAGWGIGLAYRMRSMAAASLIQFGIFFVIFLSTAQMPLSFIKGWVHTIARVNPATNILRLARQGFLGDVTWHDTWGGLVAIGVMGLLSTLFAFQGLRTFDR
jgi:ABC-2 type transport system permease protein